MSLQERMKKEWRKAMMTKTVTFVTFLSYE
jgi:hypothetical protein